MKKLLLAFLCVFCVACCGNTSISDSSKKLGISEVFSKASPYTYKIVNINTDEEVTSSGSGFLLDSVGIITAKHCIECEIDKHIEAETSTGERIPIKTVRFSNQYDLALLIPTYPINGGLKMESNKPFVGETVFVVGYPLGLNETINSGCVSAICLPALDKFTKAGHILEENASLVPGDSGGPILDDTGNVLAISGSAYTNFPQLSFGIPNTVIVPELKNLLH